MSAVEVEMPQYSLPQLAVTEFGYAIVEFANASFVGATAVFPSTVLNQQWINAFASLFAAYVNEN